MPNKNWIRLSSQRPEICRPDQARTCRALSRCLCLGPQTPNLSLPE